MQTLANSLCHSSLTKRVRFVKRADGSERVMLARRATPEEETAKKVNRSKGLALFVLDPADESYVAEKAPCYRFVNLDAILSVDPVE